MRLVAILTVLNLLAVNAALAAPRLTPADEAAAFRAAGFKRQGSEWVRCEDTETMSRQSGSIEVTDLNGDGSPEAWVLESSLFCYGNTASAFVLLTKTDRGWKVLLDQVGIAVPMGTKTRGWPDITVGGPGMGPMPVYRFNGVKYELSR